MTIEQLARSYFAKHEIEHAKTQTYGDPVQVLANTAKESMRGHVGQTEWVDTVRGKVRVYLNGRSPRDGKPDLTVTCERLADVALGLQAQRQLELL